MPTKNTLRRKRAPSNRAPKRPSPQQTVADVNSPDSHNRADNNSELERLTAEHRLRADHHAPSQSRVGLYLEWSGSLPIGGSMTREQQLSALDALDAWSRWARATIEDGTDTTELRRIGRAIVEMSAAAHRVRLRPGTLDVLKQQLAAADLRNIIIQFALGYASSVTSGDIKMIPDGVINFAKRRSGELAVRLTSAADLICHAIEALKRPRGRAEAIYLLERVLLARSVDAPNRQNRYGSADERRSAERRFDGWTRARRSK